MKSVITSGILAASLAFTGNAALARAADPASRDGRACDPSASRTNARLRYLAQ